MIQIDQREARVNRFAQAANKVLQIFRRSVVPERLDFAAD